LKGIQHRHLKRALLKQIQKLFCGKQRGRQAGSVKRLSATTDDEDAKTCLQCVLFSDKKSDRLFSYSADFFVRNLTDVGAREQQNAS
jgi:hypothetical protein